MAQDSIILAETSAALTQEYTGALARLHWPVRTVSSFADALDLCRSGRPAFLILDLGEHPQMDGLTLLEMLRKEGKLPPVIVMSGQASVNLAVRAMRLGARDFLIKPFSPERLLASVQANLPAVQGEIETLPATVAGATLESQASAPAEAGFARRNRTGFIGTCEAMLRVYEQIEHAARSQATVFITGESGTGKEVCAEAIHALGRRADKPFVPINCAAIPRDLMESELFGHVKGAFTGAIADREGAAALAHGGTLFLDEVAEMAVDMQTKLLRFLQDFTFMRVGGGRLEKTDVRIVCATNRDPLAETRTGRFREDLFYRLHVVPIHMPPLRERGDDIIDLAVSLLRRYAFEEGKTFTGFTEDAEGALRRYAWPGNIRQLQNALRNIVVMHDASLVTLRMLPAQLLHKPDGAASAAHSRESVAHSLHVRPLAEVEREVIERALDLYAGNIARAASVLGVSPSTIYRKKAGWDQDQDKPGRA